MYRIFFFIFFSTHLFAQEKIDKFIDFSEYKSVKMSPTGEYLAISRLEKGESELLIVETKNMKAVNQITIRGQNEVGQFFWANDSRVIIKVFAHRFDREFPVFYGELVAIDAKDDKGKIIFGPRLRYQKTRNIRDEMIKEKHKAMQNSWPTIIDMLPNDNKHILISALAHSENFNKKNRIYKLNIYDGNIIAVAESPAINSRILTDEEGNLAMAIAADTDANKIVYRYIKKTNSWQKETSFNYGSAFIPFYYESSTNSLLVIDNIEHDTRSLYQIDLVSGKRKTLFNDPIHDIDHIQLTNNRKQIFAVVTETPYPNYHFLQRAPAIENVLQNLIKGFKQQRINITSHNNKLTKFVVFVSNDRDPGQWYLYDNEHNKATFIIAKNKRINPADMNAKRFFTVKVRDGETINGFITLPATQVVENLPAVLLVHGGPFGVKEKWRFENEAQLLAAQGYAVIQMNYRGSGGFGDKFESLGYKHWGDTIQYDLLDTINYLAKENIIDSNRICIMGTSFGGYSAVQASILSPDSFKCAIATSGVYDLELLYTEGDIKSFLYGESFLKKKVGIDKKLLWNFSPVNAVAHLKTPLLITHGSKDKRAPIEHAEQLIDALEDNDKVFQWLKLKNEGHGIYDKENRQYYYQQVLKFLHKYNPVNNTPLKKSA